MKKITKTVKSKVKVEKQKVLAIVGPTGSGKTALAKVLAGKFNGKLISADSRQVYRGLDIGTAKDKTYPQDMVDIIDPGQSFSLSDWQKLAQEFIDKYLNAKILPILVGGTGLYIDSVVYGYVIPELNKESMKIRQKLELQTDAELYTQLQKIDPEAAEKIDPRNKRRTIRALEYYLLNEQPFSKFQKKKKPAFKTLMIGLDLPRETLYAKIDARVEQMIKEGLVEEVRKLAEKYPADLPALNTIGYKEIIDYLHGRLTLPQAVSQIKFHTHAYVRRQDTWFRRDKNIKWVKNLDQAEELVKRFLK